MEPLAWLISPLVLKSLWLLCLVATFGFWGVPGQQRLEGGRS